MKILFTKKDVYFSVLAIFLKRMKQLPSRRVIKTHLAPQELPKSIFQKKTKASALFKVLFMFGETISQPQKDHRWQIMS